MSITKFMLSQPCMIQSCKSFLRNYRNRSLFFAQSKYVENRLVLYDGFTDAQEIYIIKLLDKIHCFVQHSMDTGYKLTDNEITHIEQNRVAYDEEYDVHKEIMDNRIKSIYDIYSHKALPFQNGKHQNGTSQNDAFENEIILNIDRFTTEIGAGTRNDGEEKKEDNDDDGDDKAATAYSFGYAYKYWKDYEHNKWFIPSKYRDLKVEITSNDILSLSMCQFNEEVKNAIDLINCKYGKKIICKYLRESMIQNKMRLE